VRNGNLPSLAKGWQWRKFGDCAQFINGRAYSQEELLDSGTPVLRIQNLNGGDRWYYSNLKLPDEKYCEAGDLLYAWSASFGPYRFAGPKSIFHYHIWRVIPGEELDKTFAFHLLEEITTEVKSAAHGVAMLHMTKGGIEAWPIPLPPLAEQRRIAEVLDLAEALRAKRRAALAQLDSLTKSLFLDLFGDPATNPKGWPKVELGDVVKLVGGYAFKSEDFAADGNAVVRISNLTGDGIDLDGIARIPDDKLGKGVGYKIHPGDILIAMSGATTGKLGVVPLELSEDLYLNQRVGNYRIRDAARIQREFLLGLLRSPFYQRFLWQLAAGVAQPNVSGWQLESAVVSLPPISLQREFARRVTAVEKLKTAQRASLAELDALFATLQHRAFRGEL
jgi:type I restriction enzyme S subunit